MRTTSILRIRIVRRILSRQSITRFARGPGWQNTLLSSRTTKHGGCYDHVVPPSRDLTRRRVARWLRFRLLRRTRTGRDRFAMVPKGSKIRPPGLTPSITSIIATLAQTVPVRPTDRPRRRRTRPAECTHRRRHQRRTTIHHRRRGDAHRSGIGNSGSGQTERPASRTRHRRAAASHRRRGPRHPRTASGKRARYGTRTNPRSKSSRRCRKPHKGIPGQL